MYGDKDLPDEVFIRLKRMNELCQMTGGELKSRQVIAMVMVDWEMAK